MYMWCHLNNNNKKNRGIYDSFHADILLLWTQLKYEQLQEPITINLEPAAPYAHEMVFS